MLFPLGTIVASPGAMAIMANNAARDIRANVRALLTRHSSGDWGDVPRSDAAANDVAITDDARILSSYRLGSERLWVITEADRSATTILTPEEY